MTKVVGTQAIPNIALQDPRQRRQKTWFECASC